MAATAAVDSLRKENDALRARIVELEAAAAAAAGTVQASPSRPSQPTPSADGITTTAVNHNNDNNRTDSNEDGEETRGNGTGKGERKGKAGMTAAEIARYSRHLLVPAVGVEGQRWVVDRCTELTIRSIHGPGSADRGA